MAFSESQDTQILFEDKFIKITDRDVTIFWYYFPFAISKIIPLEEIKNVELEELCLFKGKYRMWGMDFHLRWFPMDFKRPSRTHFISIDNGCKIKPSITSDKIDEI